MNAAGAGVAGAEITGRVVGWLFRGWQWRDFSLPGARCAMWRNQHPFVGQGIEAAMRIFGEFQKGGLAAFYAERSFPAFIKPAQDGGKLT